jgi:TATA-box binding protein (TBP) (component of TFIID and TFIIIB)
MTEQQVFTETLHTITSKGISPFKLSTMTVCSKFNSDIDIVLLHHCIRDVLQIMSFQDSSVRKHHAKKGVFFNSVSFSLNIRDDLMKIGKVNIKIFTTGSIQITGCKSIKAVYRVPKIVFEVLCYCKNHIDQAIIKQHHTFSFSNENIRIVLINGTFNINKTFDRDKLFQYIYHHITKNVKFNPDVYNAINLKLNQTTLLIFHTGKIIITGGNNIYNYKQSYHDIIRIIDESLA